MTHPIQHLSTPATLSIGSVTGGATASAALFGPPGAMTLNLVLPRGEDGLPGADGTPGADGSGRPWIIILQSDYDAIATPDPDTIYDIIPDVTP